MAEIFCCSSECAAEVYGHGFSGPKLRDSGSWSIEREFANGVNHDFYVKGVKGSKANILMTYRYKKFEDVRAEGSLDHGVEVENVITTL